MSRMGRNKRVQNEEVGGGYLLLPLPKIYLPFGAFFFLWSIGDIRRIYFQL